MKRRGTIFVFCLFIALTCSFKARADIEAIQAVITALGDVVEGAKEQVQKVQSLYESGQQLASQAKKYADEAKETIDKGKKMYADAKEKAEAIKAKAQDIKTKAEGMIDAVKNKDVNALQSGFSGLEFSSLKSTFDGSHDDDEMAEDVLDTLVRKKGKDSIASQKALSEAINKKNGLDVANFYAKSTVLRQNLMKEKDDFKNPQSVDEAIELCQKVQLRSMQRQNEITALEGSVAKFHHTHAMEGVSGDYQEGDQNE